MIPPDTSLMSVQDYKQLTGKQMQRCLDSEGIAEAMQWIMVAAEHGFMPLGAPADDQGSDDERPELWGRRYVMGAEPNTAILPVIQPTRRKTTKEFWSLPEDLVEGYIRHDGENELLLSRWHQFPSIGYQRVRRAARPTHNAGPGDVAPAPGSDNDDEPPAAGGPDAADGQPPARRAEEAEDPAPVWGAEWSGCKVGELAILETQWGDGSTGIDVVKVTGKDDEAKTLSGKNFTCSTVQNVERCIGCCTVPCCSSKCLLMILMVVYVCRQTWHLKPRPETSTVHSWAVICYAKKLTKQGKLPAAAQRAVTDANARRHIFRPPPRPEPESGSEHEPDAGVDQSSD